MKRQWRRRSRREQRCRVLSGHTELVESRLTSDYRELQPPAPLAPYVECLWVQRISDGDGEYTQPVLPDACIDIVALGDDVLLAGPATRSTTLHLHPGTLTVGARLRTGAAPALINVSAAELRDAEHRLEDVWGRAGMTLQSRVLDGDACGRARRGAR